MTTTIEKPNDVTEATDGGLLSPPPCSQSIQVRGPKFLVFDADAKPIHVGDTLEWQETSGPYGQTKRGRGTVTQEMLLYGRIITDGGTVNTHWEWKPEDGPEGLYCRHENHSYDHGHKTWARTLSPNTKLSGAAGATPEPKEKTI